MTRSNNFFRLILERVPVIQKSIRRLPGSALVPGNVITVRFGNRFEELLKLPLPVCFKRLDTFRDYACHCSSLILHNVNENEQNCFHNLLFMTNERPT